ncbi:deoxyribonuclease IV [Lachnoclostridium pacaense]|uniref:deoxyribonuclease IV n=1 Tax=Enterocloster hominis (ex Hitch et al. 2024) TaxID=1917870 RepID=UPI001D11C967|nr:deoxyribonuclease IV [Lachnoclostridium pacaense]MCC2875388.1 deoxyribonuclease IV [Lachnoclostridium pacaense]
MIRIGCHLSSSKGYESMAKDAISIDANTFQFFTRNPRGGNAKAINEKDVERFLATAKDKDITPLLAHAPYTLNACSADPKLRDFAKRTMADDLVRMEYTPGNMYNFHPGCHVKQGVETGITYIAQMLNEILSPDQTTTVLLETMAGKGSEIGGRFEELKQILDLVDLSDHMGVCLDTCHVWDGGYDIVNHLDEVLNEFDQIIGLNRLKAIHLNDSQNPLCAHKDRHAKLGEGYIGLDTFKRIVTHPILGKLPFYMETPNDLDGYAREIHMMREAAG